MSSSICIRFRWLVPTFTILALAVGGAGCGLRDEESGDLQTAEQAVQSVEAASVEGDLALAVIPALAGDHTAEELADAAADSLEQFTPPACVTSAVNGTTATWTFDDCHGPYGLVGLTGTVTATFTVRLTGVEAEIVATGLTTNGFSGDLEATVSYAPGDTDVLSVETASTAAGPRGWELARTGSYDVVWDEANGCIELEGTWATDVAGVSYATTVAGYVHCSEQCPAAGGVIDFATGLGQRGVSVTFDGSAQASWSTPQGRSGTIPVVCSW